MGENFDERLQTFSDKYLAAVDETVLAATSLKRLEIERRKRALESESAKADEDRRRFKVTTAIAAASVVVTLIGVLVAVAN